MDKIGTIERKEILIYWNNKNQSKTYSKKLNKLFFERVKLLSEHPKIGRLSNNGTTRITIVRDYLIFYEFTSTELIIYLFGIQEEVKKTLKLIILKSIYKNKMLRPRRVIEKIKK